MINFWWVKIVILFTSDYFFDQFEGISTSIGQILRKDLRYSDKQGI